MSSALLAVFTVVACDDDGTTEAPDGGANGADAASDAATTRDTATVDMGPSPDLSSADAPPKDDVPASEAFAKVAGSYTAKAATVQQSAANDFDLNATYTFTITADGKVTIAGTKQGALVFDWAVHGKEIKRATQGNGSTTIKMEDPGKRDIQLGYLPNGFLYLVAGSSFVDPPGTWFFDTPMKQ